MRVRIMGSKAFLTIKGKTTGIARTEFECEIPLADAEALLVLCGGAVEEKVRHCVPFGGRVWEVDVFGGTHAGLVLAKIELETEEQPRHSEFIPLKV